MSYGAAQHALDAQAESPAATPNAEPLPNLTAGVAIDVTDSRTPIVLLRLANAGIVSEFRIKAADVVPFMSQLTPALMQAAQQALAAAGPHLATPPAAGDLIVPGRRGVPPFPRLNVNHP